MARKKNRGQFRILEEIKNQLLLQAQRWGRENYYTPLKLEEMELEQCRKLLGDLLSEKINLEYEALALESDRKEIQIKLGKLELYVKKASTVCKKHEKNVVKMITKVFGDPKKIKLASDLINARPTVSVLISDN